MSVAGTFDLRQGFIHEFGKYLIHLFFLLWFVMGFSNHLDRMLFFGLLRLWVDLVYDFEALVLELC